MKRLIGWAAWLALFASCGIAGKTCETPGDCVAVVESCDFVNHVCVAVRGRDAGRSGATGGGEGGGAIGGGQGGGATGGGMTDAGFDAGIDEDAGFLEARLSAAQASSPSSETSTGFATFGLIRHPDGGYTLNGSIVHNALPTHAVIRFGYPGERYADEYCTLPLASGMEVRCELGAFAAEQFFLASRLMIEMWTSTGEIRGQLIPLGSGYWSAPFEFPFDPAGAQLVVQPDGGAQCAGGWQNPNFEAIAAHVHQGGPGGTGSVVATLDVVFPFSFSIMKEITGSFPEALLTSGIGDGGFYVDVHAADGGLMRGQLKKQY